MTQRERRMLLVVGVLGGFFLLFGGFYLVKGFLNELEQKDSLIQRLEADQRKHRESLLSLSKAQRQLDQWKAISMPPDAAVSATRYRQFLQELARKHGLTIKALPEGTGVRGAGARNALVFNQTYSMTADGTLARVVGFLREFYSFNLAHQIKNIEFTARDVSGERRVEMKLTVETMTLPNAPPRDHLMPTPDPRLVALEIITGLKHGPIGIALGPWTATPFGLHGNPKLAGAISDRDYTRLVAKNVFAGVTPPAQAAEKPKPDPGVLRFVHLTDITGNFIRQEATLWNRLTNRHIRLRCEGGFDTFEVRDANDQVILKGKVERIIGRDVVISVDGKRYALHINETLQDALERTLSDEDLKRLLGSRGQAPDDP